MSELIRILMADISSGRVPSINSINDIDGIVRYLHNRFGFNYEETLSAVNEILGKVQTPKFDTKQAPKRVRENLVVREKDDTREYIFYVPGLTRDEINVTVEDTTISIDFSDSPQSEDEWKYISIGSDIFARYEPYHITLKERWDIEKTTVKYADGVLTISLFLRDIPKKEVKKIIIG